MSKRNSKGQFEKGTSGNPGGRKATNAALRKKCAAFTDELLALFIGIARDPEEKTSDRIKAGEIVWQYAHGKPPQSLEIDDGGADKGPVRFVFVVDGEEQKPNGKAKA